MVKQKSKSENGTDLARAEYDRSIALMQYHTQLLWQEFGAFLLAQTVLLGLLGTALMQENSGHIANLITLGGALVGLLLCIIWWSTYSHNYKYYELRMAQARRLEAALGFSLLSVGKELSSGKMVEVDGIQLRHSLLARWLPPRLAIPSMIGLFAIAFLFLAILSVPCYIKFW